LRIGAVETAGCVPDTGDGRERKAVLTRGGRAGRHRLIDGSRRNV
jgi:hypothetical protein